MQFDLKIDDSFESFLLKPVLNTFLPKKPHLEQLLHTLENGTKLSYNGFFLFLSNSSPNERNDTQDFLMCFRIPQFRYLALEETNPSDQAT